MEKNVMSKPSAHSSSPSIEDWGHKSHNKILIRHTQIW